MKKEKDFLSFLISIFLSVIIGLGLMTIINCGDNSSNSNENGTINMITILGHVNQSEDPMTTPFSASNAQVTASTDLNNNAIIEANEKATATTDNNGDYNIQTPVKLGKRIVIGFSKDGYTTAYKTITINSFNDISEVDGTITKMEMLRRTASGWSDQGNTLQIKGIELSSAYGKVFNPVTDTDRFPGSFSDNQNNILESGVFAAFDLKDESGNEINQLASGTAEVRMKVPKDTWPVIRDLETGNGQIDVPMYYFDEDKGEWVRGATDGWLEDSNNIKISESEIPAINNQTYSDVIYAVSNVTHFSYWNVDWPVSTHACIKGTAMDPNGNGVTGAIVNIQGVTYTGYSTPQVTDEMGEFCIDVMRSESPGEDINNNGISGEIQQVYMTVKSVGKIYRIGPFDVTANQGSCPNGCMIRNVELIPDNEIDISPCDIYGNVYQDDGNTPATGVYVYAVDETLDPAIASMACGPNGCQYFAFTDPNGYFQITAAFSTNLKLTASYYDYKDGVYYMYLSEKSFTTCPGNIDIDLELISCIRELFIKTEQSGLNWTISWDPNDAVVQSLSVMDAFYQMTKWLIVSQNGFNSPVTYGELPANTEQILPETGSPDQFQPTDIIVVNGTFTDNGNECTCVGMNFPGEFPDGPQ